MNLSLLLNLHISSNGRASRFQRDIGSSLIYVTNSIELIGSLNFINTIQERGKHFKHSNLLVFESKSTPLFTIIVDFQCFIYFLYLYF